MEFTFDEKESPEQQTKPHDTQIESKDKGNKIKKKKKVKGAKIDFYKHMGANMIEYVQNESEVVIEETLIKNKWTKLKEIPVLTCQRIELCQEIETEYVVPSNPKKNKKNKKQKKLDWESKYAASIDDAPVQ